MEGGCECVVVAAVGVRLGVAVVACVAKLSATLSAKSLNCVLRISASSSLSSAIGARIWLLLGLGRIFSEVSLENS